MERDIIAGAFTARVRTGSYGRGNVIKVSGVTDALAAISKTIDLAGQHSQLHRSDQKYQFFIEGIVEGYRRADPPTIPQLAVHVTVPHAAFKFGLKATDAFSRMIGCLTIVAFYYLL